jgi:hypothetical protein
VRSPRGAKSTCGVRSPHVGCEVHARGAQLQAGAATRASSAHCAAPRDRRAGLAWGCAVARRTAKPRPPRTSHPAAPPHTPRAPCEDQTRSAQSPTDRQATPPRTLRTPQPHLTPRGHHAQTKRGVRSRPVLTHAAVGSRAVGHHAGAQLTSHLAHPRHTRPAGCGVHTRGAQLPDRVPRSPGWGAAVGPCRAQSPVGAVPVG